MLKRIKKWYIALKKEKLIIILIMKVCENLMEKFDVWTYYKNKVTKQYVINSISFTKINRDVFWNRLQPIIILS